MVERDILTNCKVSEMHIRKEKKNTGVSSEAVGYGLYKPFLLLDLVLIILYVVVLLIISNCVHVFY